MEKKVLLCLASLMLGVAVMAQERVEVNLNFGWLFHAGDVADTATVALDAAAWQTVNVPHDFQIGQDWVPPVARDLAVLCDAISSEEIVSSLNGIRVVDIDLRRQ